MRGDDRLDGTTEHHAFDTHYVAGQENVRYHPPAIREGFRAVDEAAPDQEWRRVRLIGIDDHRTPASGAIFGLEKGATQRTATAQQFLGGCRRKGPPRRGGGGGGGACEAAMLRPFLLSQLLGNNWPINGVPIIRAATLPRSVTVGEFHDVCRWHRFAKERGSLRERTKWIRRYPEFASSTSPGRLTLIGNGEARCSGTVSAVPSYGAESAAINGQPGSSPASHR